MAPGCGWSNVEGAVDRDAPTSFVRDRLIAPQPPPSISVGLVGWLSSRLFNGVVGSFLSLACLALIVAVLRPTLDFLLFDAIWHGSGREDCLGTGAGACWPFIGAKLNLFLYGFYPRAEQWRVDLTAVLGAALLAPLLLPRLPYKRANALAFFGVYPVVAFFLLLGGFGLPEVETRQWGGLLVTLVIAFTWIIGSLPLGILLALGRRSTMPAVRTLSIVFIEFWRGVPLITVLFFATYMLPLFLPGQWLTDGLLRVLIGVVLFSAAYLAEVVRGGLEAIPRGQFEAAMALGLGYWRMMGLVVLPQALRLVIPGIVSSFISLFKDTTLVQIVAIFDLLGQVRGAFADPSWAAPTTLFTGFAFAGMIYFAFCFAMSRYALFTERRLRAPR
jgi:general L-amino acid transport system permease protein